jgi:hypothetical protein
MSRVTSKDGTSIAYDHQGAGPAVILVGGGLVDPASGRAGCWENAPLATELAKWCTVYNYDRRGRSDSGDTLPYAVEREVEDLEALIAEDAIAASIPRAERVTLAGQSHVVDPKALAPVLQRFFSR